MAVVLINSSALSAWEASVARASRNVRDLPAHDPPIALERSAELRWFAWFDRDIAV
jgi:hypothetical protein